jgi:hypothetical protein
MILDRSDSMVVVRGKLTSVTIFVPFVEYVDYTVDGRTFHHPLITMVTIRATVHRRP